MLMKKTHDCPCDGLAELENISEWHAEFCQPYRQLETGEKTQLWQCPECKQLWRVDRQGLNHVSYALKLAQCEGWQDYDASALIKAQIWQNRGGHGDQPCRKNGCREPVVNGSVYCLEHLYRSGARL